SSHISLYPILLPPTISLSFFFNDTAPPEIYTLSLHDALPISARTRAACRRSAARASGFRSSSTWSPCCSSFSTSRRCSLFLGERDRKSTRLNSSHVAISYAVFCLKKKKKKN